MPTIKPSVSLSEHSQEILAVYTRPDKGHPAGLSPMINAVIQRYDWLMKHSLPELTADEWQMLLNCYCSTEMVSYTPPFRIASDMMDDLGVLELAELEENLQTFIKRVNGFSQAEQLAILDRCHRFWNSQVKEGEPLLEFIQRL